TSTSAAAGQAAKKGKHAKPTTADTTSVTAEPLPTHVDASATGPLPSIDSPTLIGSALVAALALLAVAKTRQSRVRLAAATASTAPRPAKPAPHRRRRRGRRRGAAQPADTPMWTRHLLDTLEPATQPERPTVTADADLTATANADLAAAAGLTTTADADLAATGLTATAGTEPRIAAARVEGLIAARFAEHPIGARHGEQPSVGAGSGQVLRLRGTRPFDPFADAAPHRSAAGHAPGRSSGDRTASRYAGDRTLDGHTADRHRADHHAADRHRADRHTADTSPFTPAFDTGSFGAPLDTGPFEPCWDTGPLQRIRDTDPFEDAFSASPAAAAFGADPFGSTGDTSPSQPARDTGPLVLDTGPFARVVIPQATSAFDAFAPAGSGTMGGDILDSPGIGTAAYRGRRRRRESPVEKQFAASSTNIPPHGSRHRTTVSLPGHDDRELVGAISASSTGRARRGRHRA
ncbi:hypothetical protein, partial [Nonomuraea basaltis]|uniref:hypothetical protein n=1 Tax=Nonomuraea basaltis TaxID=2495887 RepID=UPI001486FD11